ncbi:MAG: hypothetical protein V3U80_05315 [Flavobacteriaceae bacterium]
MKSFLLILAIALSTLCNAQQDLKTKEAKSTINTDEIVKMLNKLTPTTDEQYNKWLPKKAGNYKLTSHTINGNIDETPKNNIQLVYENKAKKIDIIIVDAANDASSLEMIYFAFDMDKQFTKDKKTTTTKDEPHHISKYDADNKQSQILTIINKRFGVSASGDNVGVDELWTFVKKLNIKNIK